MRRLIGFSILLLTAAVLASGHAVASSGSPTIMPEKFLRQWDPITIFYKDAVGKQPGTPQDVPGDFLKMTPAHPGAFTWLDLKTLQFRPADSWPPMTRVSVEAAGAKADLLTLMEPPIQTATSSESVTLTFSRPVGTRALADAVSVELRDLPGVDGDSGVFLDKREYTIKERERATPQEDAVYIIGFNTPIAAGKRVTIHLRLSLEGDHPDSFTQVIFDTDRPFHVQSLAGLTVGTGGAVYGPDEAVDLGVGTNRFDIKFSARPTKMDAIAARNLVRITPPVEKASYTLDGSILTVRGDFIPDMLYRVELAPRGITDETGRRLDPGQKVGAYFYFPSPTPKVSWTPKWGVLESRGPQMLTMEARGFTQLDLRIHKINPFDRNFWPFPWTGLTQDEKERPPGPGEEPETHIASHHIPPSALLEHVRNLGTPDYSDLVKLPLDKGRGTARFGLDIKDHLTRISGKNQPGHYLVGMRRLDTSSTREWTRIQVTDLALTVVEERDRIRFVVTSLSTGLPVERASVKLEGRMEDNSWTTFFSGVTDAEGWCVVTPSDIRVQTHSNDVLRVSVANGDDVLVVEPSSGPELYADNRWEKAFGDWLDWIVDVDEGDRLETPELLGHIFTERPVYKPEEPVHLEAFVRSRHKGRLSFARLGNAQFVVNGPGRLEWRYPVKELGNGTYYHKFLEENLPTGEYEAHLEGVTSGVSAWVSPGVTFKKEAYRIPRFEVALHAADKASIDVPFSVTITATYYAGGRVAERPVDWRVTQFPYPWTPTGMEGFFFSSDSRFSGSAGFRSTAALSKSDILNAEGSAVLTIDPTIEPTAQPRTYVVEGTVTGADDQTVTATKSIVVLPPFLLGLKSPRFLEKARVVEPEAVVLGVDEKPLAGVEVVARLINRQWHSHLTSSDFTDGRAKYVTDVVDEKIEEQTFVSTGDVRKLSFAIPQAGVYVLELEARDKVGRAQTVSVDFYAGGKEEVVWPKPTEPVFEVTTDKSRYDPGETATYLLNSPFSKARALVILETPDGNRYEWINVAGGKATWKLTMEPQWAPRIPVHFVLMRGRDASIEQPKGAGIDFAKPSTMAATQFTSVNARSNRVEVRLEYPEKTMPGKEVEVTIHLKDPDGNPLPGKVALWLVDRAVMALGKEQELDPLNDFIREVNSFLTIVDTRFMVEGFIPFSENPGGEAAAEAMAEAERLMNRATVRKRFETVPYYEPALEVDSTGVRTVKITMPDNLTDFLVRAKGVSGADRFGSAKGMISVRLPLIVQPALPRFVRPGDSFTAAAIGRVVEGEGGPGLAAYTALGVKVDALPSRPVEWTFNKPERIEFPVRVDQPPAGKGGEPSYDTISFKVAVSRDSDGASDAFEVNLPVKADRRAKVERLVADLTADREIELPAVKGGAREGSVHRQVLVAAQPALLKMAAGLNFLMEYPFGCTEQRLAKARVQVALVKFRKVLHIEGDEALLRKTVTDLMEWLSGAVNEEGLISFWPGSQGYVALTAWSYEFLVEAGKAGFNVDDDLKEKMESALRRALRSDYSHYIDAASWYERTAALQALALGGALERSYAGEMAAKSQYLDIESAAQVLYALKVGNNLGTASSVGLLDRINRGTIVQLYQGKEVYGGLQEDAWYRNALVLPSETRALAQVTRALKATGSADARLPILVKGLVDLGKGDGWGSTNANAAALLALSDIFNPPFTGIGASTATVRSGETTKELLIDGSNPMALSEDFQGTAATLGRASGGDPLGVRATLKWIPAEDGSKEGAESNGFAVTREMLLVHAGDAPATRLPIEKPGREFGFSIADVVEEHLEVVNPRDRFFVAVVVPLAAGMEPLNPNLATAPPEAAPAGKLTLAPSYSAYLDDQVAFYYDSLPKGTYHFYFRTRASTEGRFIQPAAFAELMYEGAVRGNSNGSLIVVKRGE